MPDERSKEIMAQTAYKVAGWLHAAEVNTGASPDLDYLHEMARKIANGMFKLAGGSSPPTKAGGASPRAGVASPPAQAPAPSCPRCDAPMEPNSKWSGPGDKLPKWRCSQRGNFIRGTGWTGCDGARWQDAA